MAVTLSLPIEPVAERRRLADEVAERLTEWILDETLPPGGLLPAEGELAARFGVSRTVIREAIRSLASYQLVRIRHGVGSYVNPREDWDVSSALQLFIRSDRDGLLRWLEVRQVLEVGNVRRAAMRATPLEINTLTDLVSTMRDQLRHLPGEFIDVDHRFHLAIARATRNPSLEMILAPILRPLYGRMQETLHVRVTAELAVVEHERIVRALRAGDAEEAAMAMAAHLERVYEEIRMLDADAQH
ncbi:MAG TPA: FadR/GntR family transcriptional regulator [Chloroflexota bacterium]|jgi:DNA-binding FadR family transcriptional regulator